MLYIPNYTNSNCVVVYNADTIRVYSTTPTSNSSVNYVDYYVNSHYMSNSGTQNFSQYSTIPTCINANNITTDFYYRNDFDSILIIFMCIVVISYFLAFKPISRLFGRWLKL